MSHQDDFPVVVRQFIDGILKSFRHLAPNRRTCRRQFAINQFTDHVDGRLVCKCGTDRLFSVNGASLGLVVPSMGVDDVVVRDMSQPKMERHHRILKVFTKTPTCFDQHVLDDIAGIESRGNSSIQP